MPDIDPAPSEPSKGLGVFCHVVLKPGNAEKSGGFYVWVGVHTDFTEIAATMARQFLLSPDVEMIEIEEIVELEEGDMDQEEAVQQISGRNFYAGDQA